MEPLFNVNGLVFWTEKEIRLRQMMADYFAQELRTALLAINPAWRFIQVEAPLLTPRDLLNSNYTDEDIWVQSHSDNAEESRDFVRQLALRPETTQSEPSAD